MTRQGAHRPMEPGSDLKSLLKGFVIARNGAAIRAFADAERIDKATLNGMLEEILEEQEALGKEIRLGERYDIHTARYSTLADFVERLVSER